MAYPTFPDKIALQAQFGPSVQITRNKQFGGRSDANIDWPRPRIRGVFQSPVMAPADYAVLVEFFWAQEGSYPFLIKDWSDYSGTLEPLGTGDGADTTWQIIKRYANSVRQLDRTVTHVRSLSVYLDGVLQTLTTDYTVNLETGVITFVTAPGVGVAITATFEFDILVEFVNDWLPVQLDWSTGGHLPDVQVLEVLE